MKKLFYIVLLFALASCASTSPYTLDLAYQPTAPRATIEEGTLTVVLFNDKRDVADKTLIGMKDDEEKFVSFSYGPARAVSDAVGAYLQNRGYIVHTLYEAWDGTAQSLKPEWGDMVIGGNIEDLHITVTSAFPKTKYRCSVKLQVIMADPKTKTILHEEKIESSLSYVTVYFSRAKAEELINSTLADALEKTLDKTGTYMPKQ